MSVPYPLTASGLDAKIVLPVGYSASWPFTIQQGYGTAVTGVFSSGDTLAGTVWPGDDLAQTFSPAVAWVSATAGTGTLTITSGSTVSVTPGTYKLQLSVTQAGGKYLFHEGTLKLKSAPGSGTALTTYCNLQDLQRLYATIGDLQDPEADQAGFVEECHAARAWLEEAIQRHFKTQIATSQAYFTFYDGGFFRSGRHNDWLKDQLDSNHLVVSDRVRRACACYALGEILGSQIGRDKDGLYQAQARRFKAIADGITSELTVELDTNGDGTGDYAISLGIVDVMRG